MKFFYALLTVIVTLISCETKTDSNPFSDKNNPNLSNGINQRNPLHIISIKEKYTTFSSHYIKWEKNNIYGNKTFKINIKGNIYDISDSLANFGYADDIRYFSTDPTTYNWYIPKVQLNYDFKDEYDIKVSLDDSLDEKVDDIELSSDLNFMSKISLNNKQFNHSNSIRKILIDKPDEYKNLKFFRLIYKNHIISNLYSLKKIKLIYLVNLLRTIPI